MSAPQMVSMVEAARRMGVSYWTLRRLHLAGQAPFPVVKVGQQWRIPLAPLETYLATGIDQRAAS